MCIFWNKNAKILKALGVNQHTFYSHLKMCFKQKFRPKDA